MIERLGNSVTIRGRTRDIVFQIGSHLAFADLCMTFTWMGWFGVVSFLLSLPPVIALLLFVACPLWLMNRLELDDHARVVKRPFRRPIPYDEVSPTLWRDNSGGALTHGQSWFRKALVAAIPPDEFDAVLVELRRRFGDRVRVKSTRWTVREVTLGTLLLGLATVVALHVAVFIWLPYSASPPKMLPKTAETVASPCRWVEQGGLQYCIPERFRIVTECGRRLRFEESHSGVSFVAKILVGREGSPPLPEPRPEKDFLALSFFERMLFETQYDSIFTIAHARVGLGFLVPKHFLLEHSEGDFFDIERGGIKGFVSRPRFDGRLSSYADLYVDGWNIGVSVCPAVEPVDFEFIDYVARSLVVLPGQSRPGD